MPFKRDFERRFNEEMKGEKAVASSSTKASESKLDHDTTVDEGPYENTHEYLKDAPPPRFSTIFTTPPSSKQPPPSTPIFESYPRSRARTSGVFVPLPLLIIIAVLFLFESTILFAYTVIGLYNTAPSRFLGLMNIPTDHESAVCNCPATDHQPTQAPINFAPNFMIPQLGQVSERATTTETTTTTATATPSLDISSLLSDMMATMSTTSSSITTSTPSSTATTNLQSQASQMASDIVSMMGTMTTSTSSTTSASSESGDSERSTVFKTVNPTPVVSSTKYVYVNGDGSTESGPQSTVYSTKVVRPKRSAVAKSSTDSTIKENRGFIPQPTSLVAMTLDDALAE